MLISAKAAARATLLKAHAVQLVAVAPKQAKVSDVFAVCSNSSFLISDREYSLCGYKYVAESHY